MNTTRETSTTVDGTPQTEGSVIKTILQDVADVAELHAVLTSPRHRYCRRRFLQALRTAMTIEQIESLRKDIGVEEYERHIHKLVAHRLVEPELSEGETTGYIRTALGEQALNAVSELERKIGGERAHNITEAGLGPNSIRLFLTIFGNDKETDLTSREIVYTPLEIGQLIRSFSRSVEGIAAIDKLDGAGLISYLEDGGVHVNPRRSTAFYHYLRNLYYLQVRARESGGGRWHTHSENSWR